MDAQHKINSLLDQQHGDRRKKAQVQDCVACLAGGICSSRTFRGGQDHAGHALSRTFGLQFSRAQFTADLMPSDLTGVSVYERGSQSPSCSIPAPCSRRCCWPTKSTAPAPKRKAHCWRPWRKSRCRWKAPPAPAPPIFVIATQNPQDQLGAFALPESPLDRF